jgi:hypothetical protein
MDDAWMRRIMRMRKWDVMDDMVIMIKGKKKTGYVNGWYDL